MKSITWRRVAIVLGVVIVGLITFGAGYVYGSMSATKTLITIAFDVLDIERIGMAELLEQYLKLKGGM